MSISKNAAYNLMGTIAPIIAAVLVIPAYLRLIGDQRYGVLAIVWMFVSYFGIFDIGLGRAVAQRIASLGEAEPETRANTFWTALLLNAALGLMGALIVAPFVGHYFTHYMHLTGDVRNEAMQSLPLLITLVFVAVTSSCLIGSLQGIEKFRELNLVNGVSSVLFFVAPLLAAMVWGANIRVVIMAVVISRVVAFLWMFRVCLRHVVHGVVPSYSHSEAKRLFSFGGWVALSSLVSPLLVFADRMLIGAVLGARAVTQYSVPNQLAERTSVIATALASSLFPRFSRGAAEAGVELSVQAVKALVAIMTPLCLIGILGANVFLTHWISPNFADSSSIILQCLLIGFWANSLARIPHSQLQGSGRPAVVAITQCLELIPFMFALYYCLHHFGLSAASAVIACRLALDFFLLSLWAGIIRKVLVSVLIGIGLLLVAVMESALVQSASAFMQLTLGITTVTIGALWSFRTMPVSLRSRLHRLLSLGRESIVRS